MTTSTATRTGHLREVERMAKTLMIMHAPAGWSWGWDTARRRAGCTHYDTRKITLARAVMVGWTLDACRETILHEIAHARAGGGAGHGPKWAAECRALGIRPERCWRPSEDRPLPPPRYIGKCPTGHTVPRERLPRGRVACARCAPYRFDDRFLITWEKRSA